MARDFGGVPEDYLDLNNLMDSTKSHYPIWMHRAITHNSWFVTIAERIYGPTILNTDNKKIPTRILVIEHIRQDCNNKVPTIKEWIDGFTTNKILPWMNTPKQSDLNWLKENF